MDQVEFNKEGIQKKLSISGFTERVLRYFLDFIQTDFKRQQIPRRRIFFRSDTGFRLGIPLRKYPKLNTYLYRLLSEPIDKEFELSVTTRKFTSPLSHTLRDLIRKQTNAIPNEDIVICGQKTIDFATSKRPDDLSNIERYIESVQFFFNNTAGQRLIIPLLQLLEETIKENGDSTVESIFELEADLTDTILVAATQQFPEALNTLVITGATEELEAVLSEFFSPEDIRERIIRFFEEFSTADAFRELRDLENTLSTTENQSLYLYFGDIKFGKTKFPIFYIPFDIEFDSEKKSFQLKAEPHLFINKNALDWITQEISTQETRAFISPVLERIVYLNESDTFAQIAQSRLKAMTKVVPQADTIDFLNSEPQKSETSNLRITNNLYFAVFDKSDESLLNDYEALLMSLEKDSALASQMFENIVSDMILQEPANGMPNVEERWDNTTIPDRLIATSPIPINEEQRKIQLALGAENCNYIVVQGPPGTGKSHTISALAFESILKGQSMLILSDKNEALDVVEDKLAQTLEKVHHEGEDFPNPILRLGKKSSYPKLLTTSTLNRIKDQDKAQRANAEQTDRETEKIYNQLRDNVEKTINAYTSVNLQKVHELHQIENQLNTLVPKLSEKIRLPEVHAKLAACSKSEYLIGEDDLTAIDALIGNNWQTYEDIQAKIKTAIAVQELANRGYRDTFFKIFPSLISNDLQSIVSAIQGYEQARMPIFGYMFAKSKLLRVTSRLLQEVECTNPIDLHRQITQLKRLVDTLNELKSISGEKNLSDEEQKSIWELFITDTIIPANIGNVGEQLKDFVAIIPDAWSTSTTCSTFTDLFNIVDTAFSYANAWHAIAQPLQAAPAFDYVKEKSKLEKLHAARMSREIDHKFVSFVDEKRALARSLSKVIKSKKQFPTNEFEEFREAFPCIIASIREYAQYVPLKHCTFDVVVIDEASQVSVAQAFPALLRAKKVVVFGDDHQFSNVKSQQASKERNATYLTDLETFFRRNISDAADRIERLKQFDVKKSILDFFKLIANAEIMLKKHFRGYQELISFSSENFYDGQLQAIKVRAKPLGQIIRFEVLDHDRRQEEKRNTNSVEAEFILKELKKLLEQESPPTVGIITPFREQLELLSRVLFNDTTDGDRFVRDLRLKIMTFDTCQGEQRELVIYSMAATQESDLLNYIFPVSLEQDRDRIEQALKVQRLNVGFSRAQEEMLFVLSKPIEQFRGSIGKALRHFENVLSRKSVILQNKLESPMEKKVYEWLKKTRFYQLNADYLEVIPQFPIGIYLKQLDKNYQHPSYRCDFLLTFTAKNNDHVKVIIEYDGFAEHFKKLNEVTSFNYENYYKDSDIERQFIIESYGYKFLRLNRFSLGSDPVETLSNRLFNLVEAATRISAVKSIEQIREQSFDLATGEAKQCPKCSQILPVEKFFDSELQSGNGGYGRICLSCKQAFRTKRRK